MRDEPFIGSAHNQNGEGVTLRRIAPSSMPGKNNPLPSPGVGRSDARRLFKRYKWWLLGSALLGLGFGFLATVLMEPSYRSRGLLEFLVVADSSKSASGQAEIDTDLYTNLQKLRLESFQRRVAERVLSQHEKPASAEDAAAVTFRDRVLKTKADPEVYRQQALAEAEASFTVRPINGTRIIEITSDSNNPEMAANFVNALAAEYIEENRREQFETLHRSARAIHAQLEETRRKLEQSETRLQEFVRNSGNVFVSQDNNTLAQVRLRELQARIAEAESAKIARRNVYQSVWAVSPGDLPTVYQDVELASKKVRVDDLKREQANLMTLFTPQHYKLKQLSSQIEEIEKEIKERANTIRQQVKAEYDDATHKEALLYSAYQSGAGLVSEQSAKANQYNALSREADILRQMYSGLLMQESQASIADSKLSTDLRLIDPAKPSSSPYKPKMAINLTMGSLFGLLAAGAFAFLRQKSDHSIRDVGAMQHLLPASQINVIPWLPAIERRSIAAREPIFSHKLGAALDKSEVANSLLNESFRMAAASIFREHSGRQARVVAVTSPLRGDGKTSVTSNLGLALTESGRRVLLIDLDLRRPRLHKVFDQEVDPGAAELLVAERAATSQSLLSLARPVGEGGGLFLLTAGAMSQRGVPMLGRPILRQILDAARTEFDLVLVDTPPMLQAADARILSQMTDGVVLVCRSETTDQEAVSECSRNLTGDGIPILGFILNGWRPDNLKRYVDRYYYASDQGKVSS